MPAGMSKSFGALSGGVLLALNTAVITLFIQWRIAATEAINHMESTSGFAPNELPPHADLMWVAAHTSLFLLLTLDAAAVTFFVLTARRKHTDAKDAPVSDVAPAHVAAA